MGKMGERGGRSRHAARTPPEYWDSVDGHSNGFASCVRDPWWSQDLTLGANTALLSVRGETHRI